jgi:hypothetical protein
MTHFIFRYLSLLLCIATLSFAELYSQDKASVVAFGKLKVEWGNLDKTKITLYQDGTKLDNFYPTDNGKFQFSLQLNHQYLFWFEKPGYVTKKVDFNTQVPSEVTSDPDFEPFPDFDFYVTLFKIYPDVDTMFFVNPVGKIKYDSKLNDFDYDKEYNLEIQRHMDEIEEQIKQKHDKEVKEIEDAAKNPVEEEKKQEVTQIKVPESNLEKKPDDIPAKESNQTVNKEEPIKAEVPKNKVSEVPKEVELKKSVPDVADVEKVNTQPDTFTANKIPQANVESSEIGGKKITRTAITSKDITLIYVKVEYKWGGRFFFIEEEPNQYRNISEVYYNLMLEKKR